MNCSQEPLIFLYFQNVFETLTLLYFASWIRPQWWIRHVLKGEVFIRGEGEGGGLGPLFLSFLNPQLGLSIGLSPGRAHYVVVLDKKLYQTLVMFLSTQVYKWVALNAGVNSATDWHLIRASYPCNEIKDMLRCQHGALGLTQTFLNTLTSFWALENEQPCRKTSSS